MIMDAQLARNHALHENLFQTTQQLIKQHAALEKSIQEKRDKISKLNDALNKKTSQCRELKQCNCDLIEKQALLESEVSKWKTRYWKLEEKMRSQSNPLEGEVNMKRLHNTRPTNIQSKSIHPPESQQTPPTIQSPMFQPPSMTNSPPTPHSVTNVYIGNCSRSDIGSSNSISVQTTNLPQNVQSGYNSGNYNIPSISSSTSSTPIPITSSTTTSTISLPKMTTTTTPTMTSTLAERLQTINDVLSDTTLQHLLSPNYQESNRLSQFLYDDTATTFTIPQFRSKGIQCNLIRGPPTTEKRYLNTSESIFFLTNKKSPSKKVFPSTH